MIRLARILQFRPLSTRERMTRIDRHLGKVEAQLTAALGRLDALRRREGRVA